jgi:hypothetical protein
LAGPLNLPVGFGYQHGLPLMDCDLRRTDLYFECHQAFLAIVDFNTRHNIFSRTPLLPLDWISQPIGATDTARHHSPCLPATQDPGAKMKR